MTYMEACEFLGVQIDTSLAECKVIYRRLAQRHHPDRGGDAEKFKTLTEAYRIFEQYRPQIDEMQLQQQRQQQRQSSATSDFKTNGANGRAKSHRQPRSETREKKEAEHERNSYVDNWRAAVVLVVLVVLGYFCWGNGQLMLLYMLGVGGYLLAALVSERMRYIVRILVNLSYEDHCRAAAVLVVLVVLGYFCWGNKQLALLYMLGVGGCLLAALVSKWMRYIVRIVVDLVDVFFDGSIYAVVALFVYGMLYQIF